MNKKLIISILLLLLLIIIGFVYINEVNKADTEVPLINSHLQKGNDEYNEAVAYLNSKNYSSTIQHVNESYKEYLLAKENTEKALDKATKNNQSIQAEYFMLTLNELDYKINASVEMYSGLNYVKTNPSKALSIFKTSNEYMEKAKEYSYKRDQLEQQYPNNFLRKES